MVLYILTFTPPDSSGGTEDCEPNGSKRSPNSVCCQSLRACNFDLLVLFRGIWTLPHLQRTCSLSLCYAFVLSSDHVTLTCTQFSPDSLPDQPPY
jgi:hypothetical protein